MSGRYPVGGNGKTDLETLAKARGLNHAQSLSLLIPDDDAAPSPPVPLYRSDSGGRPSSAPNATFTAAAARRSKRTFAASLGVASRRQSLIPEARPTSSSTSLRQGSGEAQLRTQSISSYQQRLPSVSSSGSGHKDILDAQSELKPLDFKGRVKAAGARDYGEDVADRNIRESGCDLGSPVVHAIYRQESSEDTLGNQGSLPTITRPYRKDNKTQRPVSVQSGLRTVSLNSSVIRSNSLKRRASSRLSQSSGVRTATLEDHLDKRPRSSGLPTRRQSLNRKRRSELGRGSGVRPQTPPPVRHKGGSLPGSPLRLATHVPELLADSDVRSTPEPQPGSPTTRSGFPSTTSAATLRPTSEKGVAKESSSSRRSRDNLVKARLPAGQRVFPLLTASKATPNRGSSAVLSTKAFVTELSPPPTRDSMDRSSVSSTAYHTANSSLSYPASHRSNLSITGPLGHLTVSTAEPPHDSEPAPSPSVRITSNPMDEFGSLPDIQTRHLTSSLRKLQLDDLTRPQTPRSSSLRKLSISSTTPASSDTSTSSHHSNPSQRPVSRHTAQTSVDLDPLSAFTKQPNVSQDSFILPKQSLATTSTVPPTPAVTFDMDDYISSDDDSLEPQRSRGQDETELLFSSSGYGDGFQLPGLFDTIAVTPPPLQPPGADHSRGEKGDRTSSYFSTTTGPRNRYTLTTAADSEDEEDDWTPEEMDHAVELGLSPPSPGPGMTRLPTFGEVPLQEERTSTTSARTAIRLRKEAKTRKRASGFGLKKREWPEKSKGEADAGCEDD